MIYRKRSLLPFCTFLAGALALGLPGAALSQTAPAAKPIPVRFQDSGPIVVYLPYWLARQGLFEQHGVAPSINPPQFAAAALFNVLLQGQADISYSGATPMIPLAQQGRPVKIVAIMSQGFEVKVALTRRALDALAKKGVTPESPLAARVQALRGLTIASPATGSTIQAGLLYALKKNGLDPARDVTIQPVGDLAALTAAARQANVDGIVGTNAYGVGVVTADGSSRIFIEFEKHDEGLAVFPFNVLATSDEFMKKNPEGLRRVLAAFDAAKNMIRRGVTAQERERVRKEFFPDMKPDTYNSLLDGVIPQLKGSMIPTKAHFDILVAIHNAAADTPAKVSFDQIFDGRVAEAVEKKK